MKDIIVYCDLGRWRRVKCKGNYDKGFKPVEEVGVLPPPRVMTLKNNRYYKVYVNIYKREQLNPGLFPYPDHELARRAKQK